MERWKNTARVVVMDSGFTSVQTLLALHQKFGLFTQGIVKQCSREYPKKYIQDWGDGVDLRQQRGSTKLLQSDYKVGETTHCMFAHGWADKKTKGFLFNVGTTVQGEPAKRKRFRKVEADDGQRFETISLYKHVPMTEMIHSFFRYFSAIDIHDHYRQGSLALQDNWLTKKTKID